MLADASGSVESYTHIVGELPGTDWIDRDLPMARTRTSALPSELAWLGSYDADRNAIIDGNEMCQAWLIKLAELKSAKAYDAAALRTFGSLASASGEAMNQDKLGNCVDLATRKAMRAEIKSLVASRRADPTTLAAVEAMFDHIAPSDDFRDDAFGDTGFGGSDAGGGGDGAGGGGGGL